MARILFVSGFHPATRARDLAYAFERFGQLVRCDVPAPRNPHASHNPEHDRSKRPSKRSYAFVEFRSRHDAEDAYYDMHGRYFEGSRLSIQWAKNPPSSVWRYDRRTPPPASHRGRDRERSRSPRRRSERDDRDRDRDDRDRRRRSRSPDRRRSLTPDRRRDDRDRDRARTPPIENDKKDDREKDRAQTPPYDH